MDPNQNQDQQGQPVVNMADDTAASSTQQGSVQKDFQDLVDIADEAYSEAAHSSKDLAEAEGDYAEIKQLYDKAMQGNPTVTTENMPTTPPLQPETPAEKPASVGDFSPPLSPTEPEMSGTRSADQLVDDTGGSSSAPEPPTF